MRKFFDSIVFYINGLVLSNEIRSMRHIWDSINRCDLCVVD